MRRIARRAYRVMFVESRDPFAAEVVGYVHAGIAGAALIALVVLAHASFAFATGAALLAFVALRLLLVNRYTAWVGAILGTLFVALVAASVGWFLAHAVEDVRAPLVGGVVAGLAGALPAIVAYRRLLTRRERDSLLPSSREP